MAKRKVSANDVRDRLGSSFGNVQFEPMEETQPRWRSKKREFQPLKTEKEFKQDKLDRRLKHSQYDKMDAKDMLLYFKNHVEDVGNKCPISLHGTQHNLMKTIIQKYGSYTVYTVIKFLFEAEHTFIHKRVISLYYINKNIDWLQAYGDMYEKGEDYTELMAMCKPVNQKTYEKNVGNMRVRETDFSSHIEDEEGW